MLIRPFIGVVEIVEGGELAEEDILKRETKPESGEILPKTGEMERFTDSQLLIARSSSTLAFLLAVLCFCNSVRVIRSSTFLLHRFLNRSMLALRRAPAHSVARYVKSTVASTSTQYGRTAAYRRINTVSTLPRLSSSRHETNAVLSGRVPPPSILARSFHSSLLRSQEAKPTPDVSDPPRPEASEQKSSEASEEAKSEEPKDEKSEEGKDGKEEKTDQAPPPPHGDKSPWQVFTDTLRTEFKASQEWQDSTKQLAGEVKAFNESESVRRAREASEAVTGGASKVIKGTGKVIGQSASYAWNTSAVQGVRAGINATGRGIEKASRPIRETQAFKDLSDALDDGSSARYGGWTEKDERRRLREQREAELLKSGHKPAEPMVENPE